MPKMRVSVEDELRALIAAERRIDKSVELKVVMFSDLVGSTKYKATHSTVEGLKRTLLHNSTLISATAESGGETVKVIGDEVMCVFDDVTSAVDAAVRAHGELATFSNSDPMQTKTAIHLGPVVYFKYDQASTRDPQGTTVDVAARIAGCAKPGQILVSGEAKKQLNGRVHVSEGKLFIPRGTNDPVWVHAVEFPNATMEMVLAPHAPYLSTELTQVLADARLSLWSQGYRRAGELADRVLSIHENHTEAAFISGICCCADDVRDYERGIALMRQVLAYAHDHYRAKGYLAFLLWAQSKDSGMPLDVDEAIGLAEECISAARCHDDRYTALVVSNTLAYLLAERGEGVDIRKAEELCDETAARYAWIRCFQYSKFLDTWGYVKRKTGDSLGAEKMFQEAVQLDAEYAEALVHLGETKDENRKHKK